MPEYWIINPVNGYVLVLVLNADTDEYQKIGEYSGAELIASVLFPAIEVTAEALLDPT